MCVHSGNFYIMRMKIHALNFQDLNQTKIFVKYNIFNINFMGIHLTIQSEIYSQKKKTRRNIVQ